MKNLKSIGAAILGCLIFGCAPKIYVIDRQTVLQEEAAGEWPDFQESLALQLKHKSPVLIPQASATETESKQKLYKVLNGEMGVK